MAECSLVNTVPIGFREIKSRRGRLYYAPLPYVTFQESSLGLLRARIPRPQRLRIAAVQPELFGANHNVRQSPSVSRLSKLAHSRENAKRFLRFVTASHSNPSEHPPIEPVEYPSRLAVDNGSRGLSEEMLGVDGRVRADSVGGPVNGMLHRPSLSDSLRTASNTSAGSTGDIGSAPFCAAKLGEEKPLASANGVSISITLAEPVLFLLGFDQSELGNRTTAMLRGSLHLKVIKSAKIKSVSLNFRGRAETEWPEGI